MLSCLNCVLNMFNIDRAISTALLSCNFLVLMSISCHVLLSVYVYLHFFNNY